MRTPAAVLLFVLFSSAGYAQTTGPLYEEIAAMDKKLFDGLNARDIEIVSAIFDDDLEFYHDLGGVTDYGQTVKQLKENFSNDTWPKRELVPGSLEVYPIKSYGAVQTGVHRFCQNNGDKQQCGSFKFLHLWQKKDGNWKITRVISYGH